MKKSVLIILIIFCSFFTIGYGIQGQTLTARDTFITNLEKQLELFPQEKLHLHFDRNFFVPGDRIWFKAYLVDAQTHLSNTLSRYIYVELINSNNELIERIMLRPDGKDFYVFHGHFYLSEVIPEGNYTIRAYTKYMENMGDDYFFKRTIRIGSISSSPTTLLTQQEIQESKKQR
ncbi:hypothetical protein LJC57_10470, partial [Parabacteroides sp. OttesenSCG-928-G07]|nr:hypothetical protein [Parabacteroides sp. OttesenSCG-928-G07]